ncbi:response regulator [Salsipaludibacter albus]|uniref:response regulator n=1 Tax=Salsipaludibacter albus TaxID=2849650 RepID=UPI001EE4C9E4|nr:response regulator transcription factor [Salsipaludibacter albus]MBY5161358.1 response regulator transcription factor [Salsipaludibacter albus]
MTIRIFVVEDHHVMRTTLRHYLGLQDDLVVCGAASSAEQAMERLEDADPDVVLVDVSLPGRSGLDLVDDVRSRWPLPCLVLSGHGERSYVQRALDRGAAGYVLKGRPEEVPEALRRVVAGGSHVAASLRGMVTLPEA